MVADPIYQPKVSNNDAAAVPPAPSRGKRTVRRTMSDPRALSPDQRYFEDYVPRSVAEYGPIVVSEQDVINFAQRFDPQRFISTRRLPSRVPLAASSRAAGIPPA